jgi:hypothetical protein
LDYLKNLDEEEEDEEKVLNIVEDLKIVFV